MKELSKSIPRRQRDPNFITKYFVGEGVDIGGFPDPLSVYQEFFPLMTTCRIWDLNDGDAQFMNGVEDETFDFVVSSHCLEHLNDPILGIGNWFRIIKPGGHLVVTIPEEDLYEQGTWPSDKNLDHKHTFTIYKEKSWSPNSINVFELLKSLGSKADIRKVQVEDSGYRYQLPEFDQTLTPVSESAIEFIVRKKYPNELDLMKNRTSGSKQPHPEFRRYLNQYRLDMKNMKSGNTGIQVFSDESEI